MSEYTFERGRTLVLGELETALSAIEPNSVDTLIDAVEAADQVFFVGVGRVLLSRGHGEALGASGHTHPHSRGDN